MFRKRLVVEVFDETKLLVGHADLHEVDEIDSDSLTDWPPVFDDVTDEDASDSEEPGLLVSLALVGTYFAAAKAAEYIKSRREDNRSERNRSSGASEAGRRAATAEMATLSSIGSSQSR